IRADAHMPQVFSGQSDTRAADAAAYLSTLGAVETNPPAPSASDVEAGQKLYTALACVACHVPPGAKIAAKDPARVSHEFVAAKFKPDGLKQYLLNPDAHYVWNPMPNFRLSEPEATKISTYLLSASTKSLPMKAAPGDARRGEQLVLSAGCTSCHGG